MMRRLLTVLSVIAAAQFLGGCSVLGYYSQSALGHVDLMSRSRPITEWLADESTDELTRKKLQSVLVMRQFAMTALHLPDNGSYLEYADLERSHVVWNVFATPELSLKPVKSCFPVVGCLSYRGYFAKADAEAQAARLKAEGNEVYVGGVSAYSTLGWFADPVLNTMLRWSEPRLAAVLFHELAHQKIYADDDSAFNEAFATAVGLIGVQRWLEDQGRQDAWAQWQRGRDYQKDFLALVEGTAERLRKLYSSTAETEVMRAAKAEIYADMLASHQTLKKGKWQGYSGYDHWFRTANNARMSAVSTYHRWVPAFMKLLEESEGDIQRFYEESERVAALSHEARRQWLNEKAGL